MSQGSLVAPAGALAGGDPWFGQVIPPDDPPELVEPPEPVDPPELVEPLEPPELVEPLDPPEPLLLELMTHPQEPAPRTAISESWYNPFRVLIEG